MTDQGAPQPQPAGSAPAGEDSSQQQKAAVAASDQRYMATRQAAFFVRCLRPGMRVLEVGNGPGSITLGPAEAVALGEVVVWPSSRRTRSRLVRWQRRTR